MLKNLTMSLALAASLLLLTACEKSSAEILAEGDKAETAAELKDALGDPDSVDKVGPVQKWTYKAKDGTVTFVITGDNVTMSSASSN